MRLFISILVGLALIGCDRSSQKSQYCGEDLNNHLISEDQDCDGILTAVDCNDGNPFDIHLAGDCDQDGVAAQDDCDDYDPAVLEGEFLEITRGEFGRNEEEPSKEEIHVYDTSDRLVYREERSYYSNGVQAYAYYWTYDESGNVLTYYSTYTGAEVVYFYDSNGRRVSSEITNADGTFPYETYTYNNLGQLELVTEENPNGNFFSETSYTYHSNGAIDSKTERHMGSSGNVSETNVWRYNSNGQLLYYWNGAVGDSEEYSYDGQGNLLTEELSFDGSVGCYIHSYDSNDSRVLTEYGSDYGFCTASSYDSIFTYSYTESATGLSVRIDKDFQNNGIIERSVYEEYDLEANPLEITIDYYDSSSIYGYEVYNYNSIYNDQYWTYDVACPP